MQVQRGRPHLWRTELVFIVGLLLYVGIVELLVYAVQPELTGAALVAASVVLALVPAVLWLSVFYAQDRREPEPRSFVLLVALLGGLLAAAIGQPVLNDLFNVPSWIGRDTLTEILGSILVVGFTQEFLKYAAVRYSIYYSREFDQRIDGVIYGSAAGLGYAAMLNMIMVVSSGGVDLDSGVIRIVVTQLVHGSLGALTGYFLGRNKLDRMPVWWMPLGVALAAAINGLFSWLRIELTTAPISLTAGAASGYNPWPALLLASALAVVLLVGIFTLVRHNLRHEQLPPASTTTTVVEAS